MPIKDQNGLSRPTKAEMKKELGHISPDLYHLATLISELKFWGTNPRRGDVALVSASIKEHTQLIPITIYKFPGEDAYTIITGNHRTKSLLEMSVKWVAAVIYRGSPEKARRWAVMDNRSSDVATYEEDLLLQVLQEVKNEALDETDFEEGTGYSLEDLTYLTSQVESWGDDSVDASESLAENDEEEERGMEDGEEEDINSILTLKEEIFFPLADTWGDPFLEMPCLRPDMLADPPENPIKTWPGEKYADKEWKGDWWLVWSWSTNGSPYERSWLSFYTEDDAFEHIYNRPAKYVKPLMKANLRGVVEPDFSFYTNWPMPFAHWSIYRMRFMGRYMQEAGIRVIPNITTYPPWNKRMKFLNKIVVSGIPKYPPCVALQLQKNIKRDKWTEEWIRSSIKEILSTITFDCLIIYGSKAGHEISWNLFPKQMHVVRLPTVSDVRRFRYNPDPLQSDVKSYKKKRKTGNDSKS